METEIHATALVEKPSLQDLHDVAAEAARGAFAKLQGIPSMVWFYSPQLKTSEAPGGLLTFTPFHTGPKEQRRVNRLLVRTQLRADPRASKYAIVCPAWFLCENLDGRRFMIVSAAARTGSIVSTAISMSAGKTVLMTPVLNLFDEMEA